MRQFLIFVIVGGVNTAVDFIVFNLLSHIFLLETTVEYALFKSIAFIVAATNSFYLNRAYTFKSAKKGEGQVKRFLTVTIFTFLLSTGITTVLFSLLNVTTELGTILIGNICLVIGIMINLGSNFFGYKLFVFRTHNDAS